MFHMMGTSFTAANTGVGVFSPMTTIQDGWLTKNSASTYFIPVPPQSSRDWRLLAAYAQGPTATVARVNNANLQAYWGLPSIIPVVTGATVPSLYPLRMFGAKGPVIPVADQFGVQLDATAAELQRAACWLHDGQFNIAPGPISALQFTASVTTVAETWSQGTITLAQALQPGTYEIVGLDVVALTNHFARLVSSNGGPRPGVLSRASTTVFPNPLFSGGNLGPMGRFTNYSIPSIELLNSATGTIAVQGVLEVVRIGPAMGVAA